MTDFIQSTKEIILKLTGISGLSEYIKIFVVAFTSYQVAKYNASKPNALKIKQLQLDNVYLPLFTLLEDMPNEITIEKALYLNKKITNILDRSYPLVFPQMHTLNKRVNEEIVSGCNFSITLKAIKHQVLIDYELLKKALGYPSENFNNIYIRMTFKQKALVIVPWFNLAMLFVPILIMIPLSSIELKPLLWILLSLTIYSGYLFISVKVSNWVSKLED